MQSDDGWPGLTRRQLLGRLGGGAVLAAALGGRAAPAAAKKDPRTLLVYDPIYKKHVTGGRHPESPRRCDAIMGRITGGTVAAQVRQVASRQAGEKDILACHTAKYVAQVRADVAAGEASLTSGDTSICADSLTVAQHAAGGVTRAVDEVVAGRSRNAFCVVRPPGHHATPSRGMGFCVFNNVAVATRYAQQKHRIGKVLIVDWDVHHGNGTQAIFYEDPSVMYFSTHQWPWYPHTGRADETGRGKGKGTTWNCPFPAGAGRKEIVGAFQRTLRPAAKKFKPEMVFISAGFDSRKGDPLGQFKLTDADFAELTKIVMSIADENGRGRVVSVLEGGYALDGLASAAEAHCLTLAAQAG